MAPDANYISYLGEKYSCPQGHKMLQQAGAVNGAEYNNCDECYGEIANIDGPKPKELFTRCDKCDYNLCTECGKKGKSIKKVDKFNFDQLLLPTKKDEQEPAQ